jgi:hypothetical protein
MNAIEKAANISVGRACGFCGLAIICIMVGFSQHLALSAQAGGIFALIVAGVLALKAAIAYRTPYRDTETWLILDESQRPPKHQAQQIIAPVLRRVYLEYARFAAIAAMTLFAAALVVG